MIDRITARLSNVDWMLVTVGAVIGVSLFVYFVYRFGRSSLNRLMAANRALSDRPLPHPFPGDMVVASYKRRKRRRHGRHKPNPG